MGLLDIALTLHDGNTTVQRGLFYRALHAHIDSTNIKDTYTKLQDFSPSVNHEDNTDLKIASSKENELAIDSTGESFSPSLHPDDSEDLYHAHFSLNPNEVNVMLNGFSPTAETPLELFSFLKEKMGIEKGALLLLDADKRMHFPWAITGFDETTNHRLRIPSDLLESILSKHSGPIFFLSNKNILQNLDNYFSIREFSVLERLLIMPFIMNNEVIGILIVTSARAFSLGDALIQLLVKHQPQLANLIYESRANHFLSSSGSSVKEKDEAVFSISEMITSLSDKSTGLVLFVFDLQKIIKQILKNNKDADSLRLREDVLRLLAPMVGENGSIVTLDNLRLLLILPKYRLKRNDLFAHQITSAVRGFFTLPSDTPDPISHIKSYPEDGKTAEELLSDILN